MSSPLKSPARTFINGAEPRRPVAQLSGPVAQTKITEAYARLVARSAYFWAWPMVNIYNRRLANQDLREPALSGGVAVVAPLNRLAMFSDYINPAERLVACPNQDV